MKSPARPRSVRPWRRRGHGAQVQIGDVAHIDDAEIKPRAARHGAVHQAPDQQDRRGKIRHQHRAEHDHGIDDGKLEAAALASDKIPGRAFGQGFGFGIGADAGIHVCPGRFVERPLPRRVAIADRGERRSQDHALDAGFARGAQDAQRAVARGDDQFVLMLGAPAAIGEATWRTWSQPATAWRPAGIAVEIGRDKRQRSPGAAPPASSMARTSPSRVRFRTVVRT